MARHASTVRFHNGRQQREERRAQVGDTLVDDQNVHRLKQTSKNSFQVFWIAREY